MKKKAIFAIVYDFDKTLCCNNSTDIFIEKHLKQNANEFWSNLHHNNKTSKIEPTLSYMLSFIEEAKKLGITITKEVLNECGKHIDWYPGVEQYFEHINNFVNKFEYETQFEFSMEHHIISSGLKEIIEGSSIAKHFTSINACSYVYDDNGIAYWPNSCISSFSKPEYLFRIRKKDLSYWDRSSIYYATSIIPFSNVFYIGDGETDIPSMTLVKNKGGTSCCVVDKNKELDEKFASQLDERVDYIVPANYTNNSELFGVLCEAIWNLQYYQYYKNQGK